MYRNITILKAQLLLGLAQPFPTDDHSLDLICPFENLENLGIPHQFFHRIILIESIPTENLHSVWRGLDFQNDQISNGTFQQNLFTLTLFATSEAKHFAMEAM